MHPWPATPLGRSSQPNSPPRFFVICLDPLCQARPITQPAPRVTPDTDKQVQCRNERSEATALQFW
jgi:hypothetical protein